ncbi:nicotinate-nucleotide--dimethylbenzimidazole phosphoribosyltransferase [Breznakiella homolactica]|uniref:Nicotinate-nucleotide--dimethylbenzimidazole phosphoribosyltransferase n=1 Tax=Breznakiella homolactica TaxID=2798577 RepID=A0A7T7XJB9_9SPIR|nr:nicotinate-nucleotide--dimethylbenzimidazole phosphoribosyltransferase [Breznakiella homolactica]QQO07479.1 nicotinate-nucleotide--dimethylbenzimidazole phosphoribosyltransferase [Breznakiella homolactica]
MRQNSGDSEQQMQVHLDSLTKPKGSLGKLETYCVRMAKIQNRVPPVIRKKGLYVFAGDHGITAQGVSLYPPEVTYQMVINMLSGGAAANALAGGCGWELAVVDAGVAGDFPPDEELKPKHRFLRMKIGPGSGDFSRQPAMSRGELERALEAGKSIAGDAETQGYDLVAAGDMGIGNTATAAALLTGAGFTAEAMVDRGTGIDEATLERKRATIKQAVEFHNTPKSGEALLEKLGSYDMAMMAGFILGLSGRGIACVLDGFPVTAAAYMARMIAPGVSDYLFAGHSSKVRGHKPVLDAMGLDPVVSLDMHLGEGTGALIGGHVIELGVIAANEMASFAGAGVSGSSGDEEAY